MDATLTERFVNIRNRYVFALDLLLILLAVGGSFALAVGWKALFPTYLESFLWMLVLSLVVKPALYFFFGLYRRVWKYASIAELKTIALAVTVASLIIGPILLALLGFKVFVGFPRSAIGIDWLLTLIFVGGLRFSFRLVAEGTTAARSGRARRVLVVGAGDAGALVVRELQKSAQTNLVPVAFLDDDAKKQQYQIHGVRVVGKLNDLAATLDHLQVDEVIIAIPSAPGRVVRLVADVCRLKNVPFRTMPGIFELLGGKVNVSRLREVDITDLLRREPTRIDEELIGAAIEGRRVLVTGAGGSIGRELCRQIARWRPAQLILLGHGENSIFETWLELREIHPGMALEPVIADIRDAVHLRAAFDQLQPQVVFHAAAHKHVPLMQANVAEAVANNIIGTRGVVETALACGVERLVMISTDKAVNPVNVYGATKRLAEMIVLDAARRTGKAFSVVRFGNVLGSRGSVVPLFKRQIAQGGPLTLTHPDMERFFMTIPEAVHLVLQAAAMGQGGEAFLLNMGAQVRILDLAEDLIRLSGLEPGRDIEVIFTGVRPGEKLSEELWESHKTYEKTTHTDIFRSRDEDAIPRERLAATLARCEALVNASQSEALIVLLDETVPGAAIRETPPPPDITAVV